MCFNSTNKDVGGEKRVGGGGGASENSKTTVSFLGSLLIQNGKAWQLIFQKAPAQKAATITQSVMVKLHQASWYEHVISSSGPYFVISAPTNTLPDNLVPSNM